MRRDRTGEPIPDDTDELGDVTPPTTTREEAIAAIRAALKARPITPEPTTHDDPSNDQDTAT